MSRNHMPKKESTKVGGELASDPFLTDEECGPI